MYRSANDPATAAAREAVLANVARLDAVTSSACALNVRYVYYGAKTSSWQARTFPPLAALRASPALEEIFTQGAAVVFRTRLTCR